MANTFSDQWRTIAAQVRTIPDTLGVRPYEVIHRVQTFPAAMGTYVSGAYVTGSNVDTVISPRPKVVQETPGSPSWNAASQLVSVYGGQAFQALYTIGPLTPRNELTGSVAGQYDPKDFLPSVSGSSTDTRHLVVLSGSDSGNGEIVCQVASVDTSKAMSWYMTVFQVEAT